MCHFGVKWFTYAHYFMVLDTVYDPIDANLTWQGMDPNFSDSDLDHAMLEAGSNPSDEGFGFDDDSDDDSFDTSDHHPALECTSNTGGANSSLPEREIDSVDLDEDAAVSDNVADLPEVIQRLQKQLLAGYTHPKS